MTDLDDKAAIGALLARFSGLFDAVLVEVHLSLTRAAGDRQAVVRLLAQDTDGTWCHVTLTIARPREYLFAEGRSSNLVLSDGLAIHRLDDGVSSTSRRTPISRSSRRSCGGRTSTSQASPARWR